MGFVGFVGSMGFVEFLLCFLSVKKREKYWRQNMISGENWISIFSKLATTAHCYPYILNLREVPRNNNRSIFSNFLMRNLIIGEIEGIMCVYTVFLFFGITRINSASRHMKKGSFWKFTEWFFKFWIQNAKTLTAKHDLRSKLVSIFSKLVNPWRTGLIFERGRLGGGPGGRSLVLPIKRMSEVRNGCG